MAAGAGAVAFGLDRNWTGFTLCAAATLVALTQLVRILLRRPAKKDGGGRRRW
ncbi:MAG TPA: hypothetical protein VNB58_02590 [Gaiellaceae bacterium]|nr:hypothetical protein [Gaiellaceae bacterium]